MRFLVGAAAVALLAGCSSGPPPVEAGAPTSTPVPVSAAPKLGPVMPLAAPTFAERKCGLSAPVKSADACATDADCVPATPCHAHACGAKSKVPPRPADAMCTEILDCASVDANRCACVDGLCALAPR